MTPRTLRRRWWCFALAAAIVVGEVVFVARAFAGPRLTAEGPGVHLVCMGRWQPRLDVLALLGEGHAQAYRVAARSFASHTWFNFAATWAPDSFAHGVVLWPAQQTIALTLKDGRTIEAATIMAMTPRPTCAPVMLGVSLRWLDPDDLERGRSRDGTTGAVLLVGFPDPDLGIGDVAGVQVRRRSTTGAAPPASGGTR